MTNQDDIAALTEKAIAIASEAVAMSLRGLVEEAFRAGQASERQRVLAAIGGEARVPDAVPAMIVSPDLSKTYDTGRRAPRGLTKEVVMLVLGKHPAGLPLDVIQGLVVAHDRRVAEKTVYNELMRGRNEEYRIRDGRWYLAVHAPALREPAQDGDLGLVRLGSSATHEPLEEPI